MLFSEVYGNYYNAVASALVEASEGLLTGQRLTEIVSERAFGESVLTIPDKLRSGNWPLLTESWRTPVKHTPSIPLTSLQKQWLKSLLSDPRIQLFEPDTSGLEDVESLFSPDTFVYYDRYTDGDPYSDERYIQNFRTVLRAVQEKHKLRVRFQGHQGSRHAYVCVPYKLEYSAKDDKFRILSSANGRILTINMARVQSCTWLEECSAEEYRPVDYREKTLSFLLTDERNGLERVMLAFSDLEKETVRVDEKHYQITLWYKRDDETEILIRILSFGPILTVTAPDSFRNQIKERLQRQRKVEAAKENVVANPQN